MIAVVLFCCEVWGGLGFNLCAVGVLLPQEGNDNINLTWLSDYQNIYLQLIEPDFTTGVITTLV